MGIRTDRLTKKFTAFIKRQPLFFVATAGAEGRVNVSPKGLDSLNVVNDQEIIWLSVSGSGNETAAHVLQNGRMTLMFCAFDGAALILRVYGTASVVYPSDKAWDSLSEHFPDYPGARNIFHVNIELVTTSCGTGVPEMSVTRTRAETELLPWYENLGEDGVKAFWAKKNRVSLDGLPTGLPADLPTDLPTDLPDA